MPFSLNTLSLFYRIYTQAEGHLYVWNSVFVMRCNEISVNVKAMSFSFEIQKYKAERPKVLKIRYKIVCSCNPIFDSLIDFL